MAPKLVFQKGFEPNPNISPRNWQMVQKLARVISVDRAQNSLEVSFNDGSGIMKNVQVIGQMASTVSGITHLPSPHKKKNDQNAPVATGKRDVYAMISFAEGIGTIPICLGFKHPEENHNSFPDGEGFENHYFFAHESGRYMRMVGDALNGIPHEEEHHFPDGSYLRVSGAGTEKTDLDGKNVDAEKMPFKAKTDDSPKYFHFGHSSGVEITIAPDGQVTIKAPKPPIIDGGLHVKGDVTIDGDLDVNGRVTRDECPCC